MDSYDYYNLYLTNPKEFEEIFTSTDDFSEILSALKNLIKKKKIKENFHVFSEKIIKLILSDESESNFLLDEVLEGLEFDHKQLEKLISDKSQLDINSLRIFRVLVNKNENHEKISEILIDELFRESQVHNYIVGLLNLMIKNENTSKIITKLIYDRCQGSTALSLQNLCYFFDKICEHGLVKLNDHDLVIKYFKNTSKFTKKQGIFIIKSLINFNLLTSIESWKVFTIILETLDDNPSHIILPSLELLKQIKVDEEFHKFYFILCESIMTHENNQVRCWGLNHVLSLEDVKFDKEEILSIMRGLNATLLYEDEDFIKNIKKFICNNFEDVFESLIDVPWTSVAFYNIMEGVYEHVKKMSCFGSIFLVNLHRQTEIIPKNIKNVSIRGGCQLLYSKILERIIRMTGFVQMLPTVVSVFNITSNHSAIDNCLRYVQRDDHEFIFNEKFPHDFLKYSLSKLYIERDLSEMRVALKKIKKANKILMEVISEFNETIVGYEDDPDVLIHETIEVIFKDVCDGIPLNLMDDLEVLENGLNSLKFDIDHGLMDHLVEIWRHIDEHWNEFNFKPAYWKILSLILKHHKNFDPSIVDLKNVDKCVPYSIVVECEIHSMRIKKLRGDELSLSDVLKVIKSLEDLIEKSREKSELKIVMEILKIFAENVDDYFSEEEEMLEKLEGLMKSVVGMFKDVNELSIDFWERYFTICSILTSTNLLMNDKINDLITSFMVTSHEHEQYELLRAALNLAEKTKSIKKFDFMPAVKDALINKIFEADVMAREVQIEFIISCKLDTTLRDKLNFRLDIAKFFSHNFKDDFKNLLNDKIQSDLPALSKKKVRYYTNSQFHRIKMHLLQPMALLDDLNEDTIDALINEILYVNNQLNISYYLEIILAKFCHNFLNRVKHLLNTLKSPALKSIFTIFVIQIKTMKTFNDGEKFLVEIFNLIFPFAMGQNYGTRCYAIISIILSLEHVKSLTDFKFTLNISKISEVCDLMTKSVQNSSTQNFFMALHEDFRFVKTLEEVFNVDCFYGCIPLITKMPFEEILNSCEDFMSFKAADIIKAIENQIMCDEMEVPVEVGCENGVNLQQKYLPYKYKMPGDNLLRTLPRAFEFYDENEMKLKPHSDLIVVASLIEHSNNLGGLARSCEIFGVSNFVINSLKATENLDFKSLSKTAEKWLKITEIKSFQLTDFLMGLKMAGYSIIGAEQTGSSVSLEDAKIPRKCVLLLGNEKEGIPSNLLTLMDLTIEIPQIGIIRSLNVHVTASIIFWEYSKQNLIFSDPKITS